MSNPTVFSVERLWVALDASLHDLATLEAAVQLAAGLDAELAGLFVEDEDLLRWSRLPFGRVVGTTSGTAHAVPASDFERDLQLQADRARQALETAAGEGRVRWSFRVARGRVGRALAEAPDEGDLLALGRRSRGRPGSGALGSTARFVATRCAGSLLLLGAGERLAQPVAVLDAPGEAGARALAAGVALARRDGGRLTLLVPGTERHAESRLRESGLASEELEPAVRPIAVAEAETLAAAVRATGARLLVLPATACTGGEGGLAAVLEAAPCPVLAVR